MSVNKIPAERMHQFRYGFRYIVAYCTGSDPTEIGDVGSKFKVTIIFIIRRTLCCCVFVPSTKFVGSIEFEIWTIVWRKLK